MAKIKFGAGVADARGSMGGTVFSRNTFGAYMRQKVSPVNPNTALQSQVRQRLAYLATYWGSTLSEAQRESWRSYAANVPISDVFGDAIARTGLQMFIRAGALGLALGPGVIDDAPTQYDQAPPPSVTFATEAPTLILTAAADVTPLLDASYLIGIHSAGIKQPGIQFYGRDKFRFLMPAHSGSAFPLTVLSGLAEDDIVLLSFRAMHADGRVSPMVYQRVTITAAAP